MAWTLGSLTLPNPQGFRREPYRMATDVQTLDGSTKRDYVTNKERFILTLEKMTQTEINNLMTEYNRNQQLSFSVSDGSLTIAATNVLVDIERREYLTKGGEYREDVRLVLTEV